MERAPKGLQKDQAQSAQQLILVEDETPNIEDFSDLDFLLNTGPIATTLNEEIAKELPTISKHLLESDPSPAPSTTSKESPYEVIDKDIDESEYVRMGSDHSIRWSSNSSEFEGSVSSEISFDFNLLYNWVQKKDKSHFARADEQARNLDILYSNRLGEKLYMTTAPILGLPTARHARKIRSKECTDRFYLPTQTIHLGF